MYLFSGTKNFSQKAKFICCLGKVERAENDPKSVLKIVPKIVPEFVFRIFPGISPEMFPKLFSKLLSKLT